MSQFHRGFPTGAVHIPPRPRTPKIWYWPPPTTLVLINPVASRRMTEAPNDRRGAHVSAASPLGRPEWRSKSLKQLNPRQGVVWLRTRPNPKPDARRNLGRRSRTTTSSRQRPYLNHKWVYCRES